MKKFISVIAALAVILSATGCASSSGGSEGGIGAILSELSGSGSGSGSGSSSGSGSGSGADAEEFKGTDIGGKPSEPSNGFFGSVFDKAEAALEAPSAPGGAFDATVDGFGGVGAADDFGDFGDYASVEGEPGCFGGEENYVPPQAGLLTGGEWNDNAHWNYWKELYGKRDDWAQYKKDWDIPYDERIAVKVTAGGSPLEFAEVSCGNCPFKAVTDSKGMAYLFYTAINGPTQPITVKYGGSTKTIDGVLGSAEVETSFDFNVDRNAALDLMIMCDTTGSMSDELEYLKAELESIVRRIESENNSGNVKIPVRTSVNFYRDEGDEYIVRQFPFTNDIEKSAKAIKEQSASGGGDFPEAVHTALDSAINSHDWAKDSTKIMFLVLDAPPHGDNKQIVDEVNKHVREAAEKGIRIIPIASSGIDKSTEYLLRVMAFTTGGTYTFLTDDSGIGGEHLEPTVGAYNVEKLADMMVRIVDGYLGKSTANSTSPVSAQRDVTVIDIEDGRTPDMAFAEALEPIFSDAYFNYYFSCIMSDCFTVKFSDGTSMKLKPALSSGKCKITDLDKFKIGYIKEAKDMVDIDD